MELMRGLARAKAVVEGDICSYQLAARSLNNDRITGERAVRFTFTKVVVEGRWVRILLRWLSSGKNLHHTRLPAMGAAGLVGRVG